MFNDNGSFLLALLEFVLFFAYLMCLFWIFGDLFRSDDLGGWGKTLWLIFIIFLPALGMLVYVIARGGGMQERAFKQQAEMARRQQAYIRDVAGTQAGGNAADQIASAKALLDSGAISPEEFAQLKAKALA